ncbi:non-ribosomal peptide synthetase [Bacillus atrophaeus]|uniref:non-ribosomal peptide synthetase n=1 Tax=Bacillus atrophaeus TaxID=1452 RepID=UPI0022800B08|nr:non-ribosomal peptide synthetase [Bacillus atrophaeus]MCY8823355.1 non-ribosomal peptide synthetase [Bacillus atrophaeus]MCY8841552.1 non-ribosomal peptide synthetase [Bacillus atrophaeus]MEC0805808.1 non-ribosomal peptide synthetase [Bacillus atrophaeus]MEC0853723.1 non-ribosomal peptide synthetase [Bacillus atrophaeus]MEC0856850.1 non-ribosomal peptide synthetase [Bacillus atrophaeus]
MGEMSKKSTLTEAIQSLHDEVNKGITFINGDQKEEKVSYKELYEKAQMVLYQLQTKGMKPGDELVLQIKDNKKFVTVFWACLLGKIIPVPLSIGENNEYKTKLLNIWNILNDPYIIADEEVLHKLRVFAEENTCLSELEDIEKKAFLMEDINFPSSLGRIYKTKPNDLAFIQFSSGSTGDPKGVVLKHVNVITNLYAIANCAGWKSEDRILCWMPLTHDMGLIGCHLTPLLNCMDQYHMPTNLFIRRPSLWMKKASEHRIAILQSPNFGYKFFLSYFKPKMAESWDLSSIKQVMNGAEPISYDICKMFMEEMGEYGFKQNSMFTVYGLAEATVGVSFPKPEEDVVPLYVDREQLKVGEKICEVSSNHPRSICFVDEGYPIDDCYVRICDDNDLEVDEEIVGHIHISGKNVMSGYYNNKQATERAFTHDGWVRTGDLGFMRHGRLVVTGRVKDILFVNGLNYYPQDIERTAEKVEGVELGRVAACGVYNNDKQRDEILIFVMYKKKPKDFLLILQNVKAKISSAMNLTVDAVIPIRTMPKTTSGKIQRYKLGQQYIEGEFDSVKAELDELEIVANDRNVKEAVTETEKKLVKIFCEVLKTDKISVDNRFMEMGIDSLRINQIVKKMDSCYLGGFNVTDLYSYPTISELAKHLDTQSKVALSTIMLPQIYMTSDLSYRFEKDSFGFSFKGDELNKLNNLVEIQKVDLDTILMSGLAYLLARISGEQKVVLQTIVSRGNFIKQIQVNLKDVKEPALLYKSIYKQKIGENALIPIQALKEMTIDEKHNSVVPFYCRKEYSAQNAKVLGLQDFVIKVDEKLNEILVSCHFNRQKLKSEKIKELMFNYLRFINVNIDHTQCIEGTVLW